MPTVCGPGQTLGHSDVFGAVRLMRVPAARPRARLHRVAAMLGRGGTDGAPIADFD